MTSVTGSRNGPYTITFDASRGNVAPIESSTSTGLTIQTRTVTEGVASTISEVQQLSFVSTGQLIASSTRLRSLISGLPPTTEGRDALLAKANELQDVIASRSSLGKIIGDKIKEEWIFRPTPST